MGIRAKCNSPQRIWKGLPSSIKCSFPISKVCLASEVWQDNVVVINAEDVKTTGTKAEYKTYKSHSGYPGGFKEVSFAKMSKEHPARIIEIAVHGMLPDNRLQSDRMARLHVTKGSKHKYVNHFTE